MGVDVKIAKSKDEYLKCLDIRKSVFIKEQKVDKNLEIDEFEKTCTHFLVYVDGQAVATGRFRIKNIFLKFERMAVLKEFRGRKLGSVLLKHMVDVGYKKYPRYLQTMHAQEGALHFYKKMGWEVISKSFIEADIKHYLMVNFLKDQTYIKNLKCLKEPYLDPDLKKRLESYL